MRCAVLGTVVRLRSRSRAASIGPELARRGIMLMYSTGRHGVAHPRGVRWGARGESAQPLKSISYKSIEEFLADPPHGVGYGLTAYRHRATSRGS
jgi:hypothetical protein